MSLDTDIRIRVIENRIDTVDGRITKHKEEGNKALFEIQNTLNEVKDAILGTMDKKGLKTLVMEHDDFIKPQKESIQAILNWLYKGAMVAGMAWLLGAKHFNG